MKVAITTFHRALNYGGVLQAFALEKTIRGMGIDCEILDYYCPFLESQYRGKKLTKFQIKRIGSAILKNGTLKRNNNGFLKFVDQYLTTSKIVYKPENISDANKVYDSFITGSDQVWSPVCAGFDKNYFLNFVDKGKKKISYAASFGRSELPEHLKSEYRDLLDSFDAISVREKSGSVIIKDLLNRNAKTVLDPTLLMEKDQWYRLFKKENSRTGYVLVYLIAEDKELLHFAKQYAAFTNKKVLYVNDRIYKTKGVENLRNVRPDEWVNLFIHADSVFTNSFHGIAFSMNFEKDFYAFKLKQNMAVNERMINILDMFGLSNRFISTYEDVENMMPIDYEQINSSLANWRKESLDYLEQSLAFNVTD